MLRAGRRSPFAFQVETRSIFPFKKGCQHYWNKLQNFCWCYHSKKSYYCIFVCQETNFVRDPFSWLIHSFWFQDNRIITLIPLTTLFPPSENKILVKQSPKLVVDNSKVALSCRYSHNLLPKEFRASLYKGVNSDVEVCLVHGNFSSQLQFHSNVGFDCDGKLDNETVTFYLRNLHVNQTDIYFCRIEILYPPPYLDNEKSNGTIIHVKGNMWLTVLVFGNADIEVGARGEARTHTSDLRLRDKSCLSLFSFSFRNNSSLYFQCLYLSSLTCGREREGVIVRGKEQSL